jgi:hypothetical protein
MKIYKKDYCSAINEYIDGVYIGDCCKKHDNECGEKGSYGILNSVIIFYNCLINRIDLTRTIIIVFGGTLFYILKYPYLAYKKYLYRKNKNK